MRKWEFIAYFLFAFCCHKPRWRRRGQKCWKNDWVKYKGGLEAGYYIALVETEPTATTKKETKKKNRMRLLYFYSVSLFCFWVYDEIHHDRPASPKPNGRRNLLSKKWCTVDKRDCPLFLFLLSSILSFDFCTSNIALLFFQYTAERMSFWQERHAKDKSSIGHLLLSAIRTIFMVFHGFSCHRTVSPCDGPQATHEVRINERDWHWVKYAFFDSASKPNVFWVAELSVFERQFRQEVVCLLRKNLRNM